jgi:2-polyprenyl-3-methyl-5-hydroxy-6-metoxy-1,4-benzoquinol methylase
VDVCIGLEVFEHLHDPVSVSEAIHRVLEPGGFLLVTIEDHLPECMHLSPSLGNLCERVRRLG